MSAATATETETKAPCAASPPSYAYRLLLAELLVDYYEAQASAGCFVRKSLEQARARLEELRRDGK